MMWPASACLGAHNKQANKGPWTARCSALLKAPLGHQGSRSWATLKKNALGPYFRAYRPPQESRGPGCSQGKKRVFKTGSNLTIISSSSCSNNLRFCSYG
jgi:hypothetical protein